ncbi:AAA family ATPase [Candidatus Poribacteria bacterium]|nr:AAA family ATPase [Candidatus Poribacteria bacterium]
MYDIKLLQDADAEKAVLGAMMINPLVIPAVEDLLGNSADAFFTTDHKLIYATILKVFEKHERVTPILVAHDLKINEQLNRVGGPDYLYDLQAPIVETENTVVYARILKDYATRRAIISISNEITKLAYNESVEIAYIQSQILEVGENIQTSTSKQLNSFTHADAKDRIVPPVKWFIPDMLPEGLAILGGPAKIGKSFFATNIAVAIASRAAVFSKIELDEPRNVTYLCFDDPPDLLLGRIDLLTKNSHDLSNLHIIDNTQTLVLDNAGIKLLETHLDKTETELLIIDTLHRVKPQLSNAKGTAYDTDYDVVIPIQNLANRRNMCIILITHTRKAVDTDNAFNQLQGSTGIQAAADTLMMLQHDSGSKTLHLTGKRISTRELSFTIDPSIGLWELQGDAKTFHQSELRNNIIDLLNDAKDGLTPSEIEISDGKGGTVSDSLIRKTLRKMVENGEIYQPRKRGPYYPKDDNYDISL